MKHFFTLLVVALGFANYSFAQTANATVFSENGDKFTLILNGEKQNASPQTNVKLQGLTNEFYQARVDFEDASLPDFTSKNFAVQKGFEVTYVIKQNKKGEYILRYQTASEIGSSATAVTPTDEPKVVDYVIETDEVEMEEEVPSNISMTTTVNPGTSSTTTTTTTTTKPASKTGTTGTTGEKVNVNMNIGGINMGVNMNVEGMDMDTDMVIEEQVVTKTTTTQTTTTATPAAPAPREEIVVKSEKPVGCSRPMETSAFNTAKKSIADKGFDDTRLSTAKQVVKANCMSTNQIVEVMGTFGFEETKLEFAKYAYDYCTDKNNYYLISDAFSFSSSTDELNEFLESK